MKKNSVISFRQEEISHYLKDVRKCPVLTSEQEKHIREILISLKKHHNPIVRRRLEDDLVTSNLRFVISIAKEYQGNGLELPDIIQEGNIGLLKACKTFDASLDIKFISYAVHWIRQSIKQALNEKSRTIRVPVNVATDIYRAKQTLNQDDAYVENPETAYATTVSLDSPIDDEENTRLDFIPNKNSLSPDAQFEEKEDLKNKLSELLNVLNDRERMIIMDYYGINGPAKTLEEIGTELLPNQKSLSKERVRQLRDKAISKLKNSAYHLFEYLD